jgi:hypothetical protein
VTLTEFRKLNSDTGRHFFDKDAMSFFRSRIESGMIGGKFFITSEQFDADSPRFYSIRRANDDGSVTTLSQFQQYSTLAEALTVAKSFEVK